jgi:hypothetical protein
MKCKKTGCYVAERELRCAKCKRKIAKGAQVHTFINFMSLAAPVNYHCKCIRGNA